MRLRDVLNQFKNSADFLLTVNGVCDEWLGGVQKLPAEPYYSKYRDCRVRGMSILMTNFMPELIIKIEIKEEQ
jgi:hypothetical protein